MTRPLTDTRLQEIETAYQAADTPIQIANTLLFMPELIAEVRRLRRSQTRSPRHRAQHSARRRA